MLKIIRFLSKRDWFYAGVSLLFIIAQVWLDLKLPDYMSEITRMLQVEGSTMSDILLAGGYMLLCAMGSLVAAFIVGYFVARIAAGLSMRLRDKVYAKTMSFSMEEIGRFSTASLITRSTNDVTQIQSFVAMGMQALVKAPILAVWAIMKISGKSWHWTLTTAVFVAALVLLLAVIMALVIPKFSKVQKFTDNINRISRENLTGIRVVRAYNAEAYQEEKFDKANAELTHTNLFVNRLLAIQQPAMRLMTSGLTLAIYWVGVFLIRDAAGMARMNLFSDMVVFSSYAMQVMMAFMMLTMIFIMWPRASVSAKRINEILNTQATIEDGTIQDPELFEQGEIEFRHVSFKYPGAEKYVLNDVSFQAKRGQTLAFIGVTGSGKSSIINLIPRFYDATEGEIFIDGINIKDYTQQALRNRLGYVPQRAVMFTGTVRSNVCFGDNGRSAPDQADMEEAVEVAQAQDFVLSMPQSYDAAISQGGTNISGGQKQRLSIARAILRKPEIYLFDDSFSALDYRTDRTLRQALRKAAKNATTLIVAQRVGTIMNADQIIVMDEGRIVGQGSHRELLASCPLYLEIAQSQLSKEEIENAK